MVSFPVVAAAAILADYRTDAPRRAPSCVAAGHVGRGYLPCLSAMKAIPATFLFYLFLSAGAPVALAATAVSKTDLNAQAQAVHQALSQSVDRAVNQLGRTDGYWANPRVRIPLPEELRHLEKTLRRVGLERYADEFDESLNHAAEAAVPAAKPVLLGAFASCRCTTPWASCAAGTTPPRATSGFTPTPRCASVSSRSSRRP
jgi:hypothetical protein